MRFIALLCALLLLGCAQEAMEEVIYVGDLSLGSVFGNNSSIPARYTCQGDNVSPSFDIGGMPAGTKTLVLIMDDPDAPMGTWDHWVMWNIPPTVSIDEGSAPGQQGKNSWGRNDYGGPCPPSGTHRYFFKLYALDTTLDIKMESTKKDVEKAMRGHILDKAELVGLYEKS